MSSSAFPQNSVPEPANTPTMPTVSQDSNVVGSQKLLDVLQMSSTSKQNGQFAHSKVVSIAQQRSTSSTNKTMLPQFPLLSSAITTSSLNQEHSTKVATIGHLVLPQKTNSLSVNEKRSTSSSPTSASSTSATQTSSAKNFPYTIQQDVSGLSVQEIAKEAMRIAKESIRQQEQQATQVDGTSPIDSKMEIDAPANSAGTISLVPSSMASDAPLVSQDKPGFPAAAPKPTSPTRSVSSGSAATSNSTNLRLNKFVRRLHDMVKAEQDQGVVEWRRGLLVLHSTATFAKTILPKFFNTRNFKTFRRQLNYYGFVHVRSFSNSAASTTTALWVHQDLAATLHDMAAPSSNAEVGDPDDLSHILKLRRVEPNEQHKTVEGRRQRKEMALCTVEEDLQVSTKSLQHQQIQSLLNMGANIPPPLASSVVPYRTESVKDVKAANATKAPHSLELEHYLHTAPSSQHSQRAGGPAKKSICRRAISEASVAAVSVSDDSDSEAARLARSNTTSTTTMTSAGADTSVVLDDKSTAANLLLLLAQGS